MIEIQHNGILMSDIIKGYRVKRLYVGYSTRQALKEFKRLCKGIK